MAIEFKGTEKRHHSRYEWRAPVTLNVGDIHEDGEIQNISLGGILVQSRLSLKYGDEVTVEFSVPKLDRTIVTQCTVRWIAGDHSSGLNFVGLKAIETWGISQLVRHLADTLDDVGP